MLQYRQLMSKKHFSCKTIDRWCLAGLNGIDFLKLNVADLIYTPCPVKNAPSIQECFLIKYFKMTPKCILPIGS